MKDKKHKYANVAQEISTEFAKVCSQYSCGECKYAFQTNCQILFVLDYMEDKKKKEIL
jgi:hypothetical protein